MSDTIWLSRVAVDILCEQLGCDVSVAGPYPFDIGRHGQTFDERARLRPAVCDELHRRRLMRDGRPEPAVAHGLRLLVGSELSIAVVALLDPGGGPLLARAAATGEHAVLAVLDEHALRLTHVRPAALAGAVVALLPDCPPGPGHSVTTPSGRRADEEPAGYLDGDPPRRPAVEAIMRQPRRRIGQFSVAGHAARPAARLAWFDTDRGRYLTYSRTGQDGRDWTTFAPADNGRLTATLAELVRVRRAGGCE